MTNESKVTIASAVLFEAGLRGLQNKVDTLNKRSVRHGMDLVEVRIVRETTFVPVYDGHFGRAVPMYHVDILGCEPCINGYRLVARVEFNDTIGNVVRLAPGACDDGSYSAYRNIGPVCEHCNSRRNRNDVFVLAGPDGSRKIVGRNCLADFVRDGDADDLARYADWCDKIAHWVRDGGSECEDEFDGMGGGRAVPTMALDRFLPVVAMLSRRIGWVSRTAAKERDDCSSTADLASYYFYGRGYGHRDFIVRNELYACPDDDDLAGRAAEWARNVDDSRSEYLNIIKRIACSGVVDMRSLDGYAASIIIAYKKDCEREAERAERAKGAKNRVWFGCEGKREKKVRAKCVGLHSFEGYYGVTTIVRFEHYPDGEGGADKAVLVWFASGDKYNDFTEGAVYEIDATIKKHDDDAKYGKDTKINRVKSIMVEEAPGACDDCAEEYDEHYAGGLAG